VTPADARLFGITLSAAGLALLAARASALTAALALTTLLVYLLVYTPMKRRTPAATLVGAVPGALPALIGWTASHGTVAAGGAARTDASARALFLGSIAYLPLLWIVLVADKV